MTEPGQGGPDVLGVRLPVLLAPPRVYDEVGGVLTPVQDEADQVGLAVDVGQGADIDWTNENKITKTYPEESPRHPHFSVLYLLPGLKNSGRKLSNLTMFVEILNLVSTVDCDV